MNILVTNDDGIQARGIRILAEVAKKFGNVVVVAPKDQQSAVGQGITVHEPLAIEKDYTVFKDLTSYHVTGKPADTVKVALEYLNLDIDLVLSGVNNGPNLGTDILYSGTVGGASEAAIYNLPSIAFSTDFGCFEIVERELEGILRHILDEKLTREGIILNVNFPHNSYDQSKGICFTKQGRHIHSAKFRHDNGKYWNEAEYREVDNDSNTDVVAFKNGFVSITPLWIQRTATDYLEELSSK